jgi:hypothetical protein
MRLIIAAALEAYRRDRFLKAVNAGYSVLREDAAAWGAVVEERALWDRTLLDGLPAETERRTGEARSRRGKRARGR